MKYVNLNATMVLPGGVVDGAISPAEYLERLPELADMLPEGARTFATDPRHYDFSSSRCVKALALERISFAEVGDEVSMELGFRHNCWKHEEDLIIRYGGVSGFTLDVSVLNSVRPQSVVILDEVLPRPGGCSHEIALCPGSITVLCRDLVATWVEAVCPDKPSAA